MHYGDMLTHGGPLLGHSRREALEALKRAVELNPHLVSGWEHLIWMAQQLRDTAAAGRGLRALDRLRAGPTLAKWMNSDELVQLRLVDRLERGDSVGADSLIEQAARAIVANQSVSWIEMNAALNGFFGPQIRLSRAVVRLAPGSEQAEWHRGIIAHSWAGRGAWDSAVAQAEHSPASSARLAVFRLAALGAWAGALDVQEAVRRRLPPEVVEDLSAEARAELAWLDGLIAVAGNDPDGLVQAVGVLRAAGGTLGAVLSQSLAAFQLRRSAGPRRAAEALTSLERQRAERRYAGEGEHNFSVPVNRLAAADWLLASGDTTEAERLLRWNEAYLATDPGIVFCGLVALQRARIARARGQRQEAQWHYRSFLSRYDLPTARHRRLVQEAIRELQGLSLEPDRAEQPTQ
jgi:hypothetical protein